MNIIGCDFHPGYQQIAMTDTDTGVVTELTLTHEGDQVRRFYAGLEGPVRVGIEATGQSQWFERLLQELGHEVLIGDPAKIREATERKQKTDRRDALLILQLLLENRFPQIWVPSAEERDLRQLLLHRSKLVRMRTQIQNQLQALAINQGLRLRWRLWSERGRQQLESLALLPWAARRRQKLLELLDELAGPIAELDRAVAQEALARPAVRRLMTHPGVGPVTALAFVLSVGPVSRFERGKKVASYFGLIPSEYSTGGRQRLGHISKQGNSFVRWLLVEAVQSAVRREPKMRRQYRRLAHRKGRALAKVALARKLAVRLYWMLREGREYAQMFQASHAGQPES